MSLPNWPDRCVFSNCLAVLKNLAALALFLRNFIKAAKIELGGLADEFGGLGVGLRPESQGAREVGALEHDVRKWSRGSYPKGVPSHSPGSRSAPWVCGTNRTIPQRGFINGFRGLMKP